MDSLPLHPAFVHLPLGIVSVLPLVTFAYLVLFVKKMVDSKSFIIILLLHGILAISINLTSARGEADSKAVRKYLDKEVMTKVEYHEEKAQNFMFFAYFAVIIFAGLTYKGLNLYKLSTIIVFQIFLLYLGFQVGQTGGELIYQHDLVPVLRKTI